MKTRLAFCILASCMLAFWTSAASAAIVVTADNVVFQENSGIRPVDIFIRSDAADSSIFLIVDFQISAGSIPSTAGEFDLNGMVGQGNIQAPPASLFLGAGDTSTLSLDFTNPQLFPAIDTVIARMFIDTTGLTVGVYNINVLGVASEAGGAGVNGTFTISAVPEPSTFALVGLTSISLVGIRRRSRD